MTLAADSEALTATPAPVQSLPQAIR